MKSCCRMGGSWRRKTKRAMMMNEIRWVFVCVCVCVCVCMYLFLSFMHFIPGKKKEKKRKKRRKKKKERKGREISGITVAVLEYM